MGRVGKRSWEAGLEQLVKSRPKVGGVLVWGLVLGYYFAWTIGLFMIVAGWVDHRYVWWDDKAVIMLSLILWATIWHVINRIVFARWFPYES